MKAVPLHNPAGTFRRAGAAQCRRAGGAQAQDALARRNHAPDHEPAGAHAAVGGAGAEAAVAPDPVPRRAGTQRQAAPAGVAARGGRHSHPVTADG